MAFTVTAPKSFMGAELKLSQAAARSRAFPNLHVTASGKRTDTTRQGLNTIKDVPVRNNLLGLAPKWEQKGWKDAQGRKGKGYGVYKFSKKYGSNVDGYSPIYRPDSWSKSGETYTLGREGLLVWLSLLGLGLVAALFLIVSTSQLGA